jgi:hypothetical protein
LGWIRRKRIGFCPGDGKVYSNNAAVATYSAAVNGDKIRFTVDTRDVTAPTLTIAQEQHRARHDHTCPPAAYYFMGTVSGNPNGGWRSWQTLAARRSITA